MAAVTVAIAIVIAGSVAPAAADPIDRALERAARARSRGQDQLAERVLRRARAHAPSDGRIALAMADALGPDASEGRASEALEALEAFLADESTLNSPDRARAHVARCEAIRYAEGLGPALDCAEALAPGPARRRALRALAADAARAGAREEAARALEAALRGAPTDAELLGDRGALALAEGDAEAALRYFTRALASAPDDEDLLRDLAGAQLAAGRRGAALALYTRLARTRDDAAAWSELGQAALWAGDAERALRAAERAEAGSPNDPRPPTLRAAVLLSRGERERAEAELEEALRRDPTHLPARRSLGALRAR